MTGSTIPNLEGKILVDLDGKVFAFDPPGPCPLRPDLGWETLIHVGEQYNSVTVTIRISDKLLATLPDDVAKRYDPDHHFRDHDEAEEFARELGLPFPEERTCKGPIQ